MYQRNLLTSVSTNRILAREWDEDNHECRISTRQNWLDVDQQKEVSAVREALPVRLGRNIASRRKALGLTQADLAERLGVDTETLSRFERGKHAPSLMTLERLATGLLTTCADLLDESMTTVTSEAQEIEAMMGGLAQNDVEFVRRTIKALRDHLASRYRDA